jgi:kynurenine formamidase
MGEVPHLATTGGRGAGRCAPRSARSWRGGRGCPGGRHGLRDLTHPLTTSFPPFSPGEEPVRETVATIEADGVENLNNLDRIPRRGATIMVGLIPYEDGSGGQARVLASW